MFLSRIQVFKETGKMVWYSHFFKNSPQFVMIHTVKGFSIMQNKNLQMSKLDLDKKEEPELKLPTFAGSQRKLGNSRETSTSVSSTRPKPLTVWIITNCEKLLKR